MDRTKHNWNVTLQRSDGQVEERKVSAYWDPTQEGCNEAVAVTARAEAYMASHKQFEFHPMAVTAID